MADRFSRGKIGVLMKENKIKNYRSSARKVFVWSAGVVFGLGVFTQGLLAQLEPAPAQPTGNTLMLDSVSKYTPRISPAQRDEIKGIYRQMANNPIWQRWFLMQRKDQLADPLDRKVMQILHKYRQGHEFLPATMDELRKIIQIYGMDHRSQGTLIGPSQGKKLNEILAMVRALAEWMPFSDNTINNAEIFALQGPMNAYTWSGTPQHIGAAFFDDLIDGLDSKELAQVVGHELAHILNEHILMGVWLDAIFYATAKNLIPDEEWPDDMKDKKNPKEGEKTDPKKSEALQDLRAARSAKIEAALTKSARELIAHTGKIADHKPEYVAAMRGLVRSLGDKIAAKYPKKSVELQAVAKDLVRAINGLDAKGEVEISKEQEKAYMDAKDRLSRSKETSSDRFGGAYLQLLFADGTPEMEEVLDLARRGAYVRLVGSRHATVKGSIEQANKFFADMTDQEIAAAFRNPGSSHPAILARISQFGAFEDSDAFLVVSDPFLSLLFDYFSLSEDIIEINTRQTSANLRELFDREVDGAQGEALKRLAALMSKKLQEILVAEIVAVQKGERQDWNATKLLYFTASKISDRGNTTSWIPGRKDVLDHLGRPRRLISDLVAQLKVEAAKMGLEVPKDTGNELSAQDIAVAIVETASLSEKSRKAKPAPKKEFIIGAIELLGQLVQPDMEDFQIAALDQLAAACSKDTVGTKAGGKK